MQQTGRGSTSRRAALRTAARLDGRRRLAACALAGLAAALLGLSGAAARGEHDQGRVAAGERVSTAVQAVAPHSTHDDRGNGDDAVADPGEHGNPRRAAAGPRVESSVVAIATPPPSLPRRGPKVLSTPPPQPPGGTTAPASPATPPPSISTTVVAARPAPSIVLPASPAPAAPSVPPSKPKPSVTLPPLVLIPPLGLPTPPGLNAVPTGTGVAPLVVVVVAMVALSVILGVRLARRSR